MRCVLVKDFTSALYLGLEHPGNSLRPWRRLTTGRPTTLSAPLRQRRVEAELARLVGCDQALLGTSTLHLFWDLFGMFDARRTAVYLDAGAYPIAHWGVERAAARGVPVHRFAHHRPESLSLALRSHSSGRRPVVVCDGFCPGCGRPAPLHDYLAQVIRSGGFLVVDDTQALGVLGASSSRTAPYGHGGGGSLRSQSLMQAPVLLISSLAKGFGVPAAMLCGPAKLVGAFADHSETLTHCSPASMASIAAAEQALMINREHGEALRQKLAQQVIRLRGGLQQRGFAAQPGLFPVQTLQPQSKLDVMDLHSRLLRLRVRTVLHRARKRRGIRLSFLLTAVHKPHDIDTALAALSRARQWDYGGNESPNREVTRGAVTTR